jgi:hypothetical protein
MLVICFCVIQFDYGTSENNNTRHGKKSMYPNMTDFMICLPKSQMLTKVQNISALFDYFRLLQRLLPVKTM